ncbi:MAG: hypothetical protein M3478_02855, partial [Planctomycetota bacterium]|nr:hypothetical protein [Planctomycetota bacterium]
MRRVIGRLLAHALPVSLLLCMAVCALWARSYWAGECWFYAARPADDVEVTRLYYLGIARGRLKCYRTLIGVGPDGRDEAFGRFPMHQRVDPTEVDVGTPPGFPGRLGFAIFAFSHLKAQGLALPMWAVAAPFAIVPGAALRRVWRRRAQRRRAARAACRFCGYD